MLSLVSGDVCESTEALLAHQCNVVSPNSKGLALALFTRFPSCDVYSKPTRERYVGNIEVRDRVVALYAQYFPGLPRDDDPRDAYASRLGYFETCLKKLGAFALAFDHYSIAMPYGIGCGLAGGRMEDYLPCLLRTATSFPEIEFVLYDDARFRPIDVSEQEWFARAHAILGENNAFVDKR